MTSDNTLDTVSTTDSEDDSLIENTFQQPPMKSEKAGILEKTGQLIASLHTVLVAKVLRRVFEVKGLLIDKVLGVIEVRVSVDMSSQSHMHLKCLTILRKHWIQGLSFRISKSY